MKKIVFFIATLTVAFVSALHSQTNYMEGAVPQVEGKVVFSHIIQVEGKDKEQIFGKAQEWVSIRFPDKNDPKNRVLLSDKSSGSIACQGNMPLVFKSTSLALDRAFMSYQLVIKAEQSRCEALIRNIYFDYPSSDEGGTFSAEKMITDEVAINKSKGKLNRYYDKFRTFTIDSVNSIFDSLESYIGENSETAKQTTMQVPLVAASIATTVSPADEMKASGEKWEGFRKIEPQDIPENYIKLLSNNWSLITSGSEKVNVMTASWGGIGRFWDKPVAICFIYPTRYSIETMDEGDLYSISFYTEAYRDVLKFCGNTSGRKTHKIKESGLTPLKMPSGATAFSEARMILECRKVLAQPISTPSVKDKKLAEKCSGEGYHKIYIGEIVNVWIK